MQYQAPGRVFVGGEDAFVGTFAARQSSRSARTWADAVPSAPGCGSWMTVCDKDAPLAVLGAAGGAGALGLAPAEVVLFLTKPVSSVASTEHPAIVGEAFGCVGLEDVVGVPGRPVRRSLEAVRGTVPGELGQLPAVLAAGGGERPRRWSRIRRRRPARPAGDGRRGPGSVRGVDGRAHGVRARLTRLCSSAARRACCPRMAVGPGAGTGRVEAVLRGDVARLVCGACVRAWSLRRRLTAVRPERGRAGRSRPAGSGSGCRSGRGPVRRAGRSRRSPPGRGRRRRARPLSGR